jgi:hypothetical protein
MNDSLQPRVIDALPAGPSLPFSWAKFENPLQEYWIDAWQRSILLLDALRQRGNNYAAHNARKAPHVLSFDTELVLDGGRYRGR